MSGYDDEIVEIVADVLNEADDDRLPDDTIWFGMGCTIADEIAARVRSEVLNEESD